jgi:cysteinyl-tRNA synthetase
LLEEIAEHREQFLAAMDDEFNTGGAIGELFEVVHTLNRFANQLTSDSGPEMAGRLAQYRAGMVVLKELSQILGLFQRQAAAIQRSGDALTAPLMGLLIDLRARLRKEKNFGLADEIRKQLTDLGVTLEDRADGTRWRIEPRR